MKNNDEKTLALRVSRVSIIVNIALSAIKLVAGIFGRSAAMVSDAVHSMSDVFSTVVVMIGVSLAAKEPDEKHPYGHERLECVAAVILSVTLFATGAMIGVEGVRKIIGGVYHDRPTYLALGAAVLSIAVKECLFRYTVRAAKKVRSDALKADAWHHRSDALSSVGALIGIGGAMLGLPVMDAVAGIVIALFIIKVAVEIFRDAMSKMVDTSCDKQTLDKMRGIISAQEGVRGINSLQSRMFGARIYVDVEIKADGELNLSQAHEIAERVHDALEAAFPDVKHCMVHVDPDKEE